MYKLFGYSALYSTLSATLYNYNSGTIPGTLSQFTGPSSGICPGDDVTFTCVVSTTTLTAWTVNSGGDQTSCNYRRNDPLNTETCGPEGRFTSSVTDVNGNPNNSSLSVDSVTSDLSGASVTCSDGNPIIIGSRNICVIGKGLICVSYSPFSLWLCICISICMPGRSRKDWFDGNNVVLLISSERGHALLHALICLCVL